MKHAPLSHSIAFLIFIAASVAFGLTPLEKQELERLGVKPAEIELIEDSKITREKIAELHSAGISVTEYFQYPWLNRRLTERDWIASRKSGQLGSDIRSEHRGAEYSEWAVVQNFFVPGLHQFRKKQHAKGILMSGMAVASLALFALHRDNRKSDSFGFDYPAYLLILGADLLWSSIDIGYQMHRQANPDLKRFSGLQQQVALNINFPIKIRTN